MIIGLYEETHNWGKTVALWQQLGFVLQFETDHHSGQLVHPDGGPYVFVAERPATDELLRYPILHVEDSTTFESPAAASVAKDWVPEHWGVMEMHLANADGRLLSLQAPLPNGVTAPSGH